MIGSIPSYEMRPERQQQFIQIGEESCSPQSPAIVFHGQNLGTKPAPNPSGRPSNQPPLCPVTITGNSGLDY